MCACATPASRARAPPHPPLLPPPRTPQGEAGPCVRQAQIQAAGGGGAGRGLRATVQPAGYPECRTAWAIGGDGGPDAAKGMAGVTNAHVERIHTCSHACTCAHAHTHTMCMRKHANMCVQMCMRLKSAGSTLDWRLYCSCPSCTTAPRRCTCKPRAAALHAAVTSSTPPPRSSYSGLAIVLTRTGGG